MVVVDGLAVLARGMNSPARQRGKLRAADEDIEPVVEQAREHGIEHLAQREAAGRCDAHADLLIAGGAPAGQIFQFRTLAVDAFGMAGVAAADDLAGEATIGWQIVEIGRAAQQQRAGNGTLEMAVRPFDGAILMGNASIVAGRRHAIVGAQILVAPGQAGLGVAIEIAEGGREAVAAVFAGRPAKHHMGVLEAGIGQPEMIEPVIERCPRDGDRGIVHDRKIRQAGAARHMVLAENDVLLLAMDGAPGADPPFQCPANATAQAGMSPDQLLEDGNGTDARGRLEHTKRPAP